ncbi:MAG: nitroreductase/quinone reductase family protein, partial [Woeseiaceae bacterium]
MSPFARYWIKLFSRVHNRLYRMSGGGVLARMGRAPMLLLTTTGRKSGKPRTTP